MKVDMGEYRLADSGEPRAGDLLVTKHLIWLLTDFTPNGSGDHGHRWVWTSITGSEDLADGLTVVATSYTIDQFLSSGVLHTKAVEPVAEIGVFGLRVWSDYLHRATYCVYFSSQDMAERAVEWAKAAVKGGE